MCFLTIPLIYPTPHISTSITVWMLIMHRNKIYGSDCTVKISSYTSEINLSVWNYFDILIKINLQMWRTYRWNMKYLDQCQKSVYLLVSPSFVWFGNVRTFLDLWWNRTSCKSNLNAPCNLCSIPELWL